MHKTGRRLGLEFFLISMFGGLVTLVETHIMAPIFRHPHARKFVSDLERQVDTADAFLYCIILTHGHMLPVKVASSYALTQAPLDRSMPVQSYAHRGEELSHAVTSHILHCLS